MAAPTGNEVHEHKATTVDTVIGGYFTEEGLPYIDAEVFLPRLGVTGDVLFLVDTGAVSTTLHPDAGRELACPFDRLVLPAEFEGVGGAQIYYLELAVVKFLGDDESFTISTEICIAKPGSPSDGLDSLLGRDILNRLRMEYDFPQSRLELVYS